MTIGFWMEEMACPYSCQDYVYGKSMMRLDQTQVISAHITNDSGAKKSL